MSKTTSTSTLLRLCLHVLLAFSALINANVIRNGDFASGLRGWESQEAKVEDQIARLTPPEGKSSFIKQVITLSPYTFFCFKATARVTDSAYAVKFSFGSRGSVSLNEEKFSTVSHAFFSEDSNEVISFTVEISGAEAFVDDIFLIQDSDCFSDPQFYNEKDFEFLGQANFTDLAKDEFPAPSDEDADLPDCPKPEELFDVVLTGNGRVYRETPAKFAARQTRTLAAVGNKTSATGRSFPEGEDPEKQDPKRIIIGADGRTLVGNTLNYPWRTFAGLHTGNGPQHICTGYFVGPRHILTAGHCLFNRATASWITPAVAWPGQTGTCGAAQVAPWGTFTRFTSIVPGGWHVNNPSSSYPHRHDYGMIILENTPAAGCTVGWLGYTSNLSRQKKGRAINTAGYPGHNFNCAASPCGDGICHGHQYRASCSITERNTYDIRYQCDTQGGQSGSPIWTIDGNFLIAVHSGSPNGVVNWARRINDALFNWIQDKRNEYTSSFCS